MRLAGNTPLLNKLFILVSIFAGIIVGLTGTVGAQEVALKLHNLLPPMSALKKLELAFHDSWHLAALVSHY